MENDTTVVFHGFLNLTTKQKMELVSSINEYFDSTDREPIRTANEEAFGKLKNGECKCCGR